MIPPTTLEGQPAPAAPVASSAEPVPSSTSPVASSVPPPPEPRREANSFADISGDFPNPLLVERQQRLRRIVVGVMIGAMGLLLLAGVCELVRGSQREPVASGTHVASTSLPVAEVPSTVEPVRQEPPPAVSLEVAARAADRSPPPAPRTALPPRPNRPKATPSLLRKLPR